MVAEHLYLGRGNGKSCSLAKISMVAELRIETRLRVYGCSLAKISMVAEPQNI